MMADLCHFVFSSFRAASFRREKTKRRKSTIQPPYVSAVVFMQTTFCDCDMQRRKKAFWDLKRLYTRSVPLVINSYDSCTRHLKSRANHTGNKTFSPAWTWQMPNTAVIDALLFIPTLYCGIAWRKQNPKTPPLPLSSPFPLWVLEIWVGVEKKQGCKWLVHHTFALYTQQQKKRENFCP